MRTAISTSCSAAWTRLGSKVIRSRSAWSARVAEELAVRHGEYAAAKPYVDEALNRLGNPNNEDFPCFALSIAGGVYRNLGELERAAQIYELEATVEQRHDHWDGVRSAKLNLGIVYEDLERSGEAEQLWAEVLTTPSDSPEGRVLTELASYHLAARVNERGDHEFAASLLLKVSAEAYRGTVRTHAAAMMLAAADAAADQGRYADARERWRHALGWLDGPGDWNRRLRALHGIALASLALHDAAGSAEALSEVDRLNGVGSDETTGA